MRFRIPTSFYYFDVEGLEFYYGLGLGTYREEHWTFNAWLPAQFMKSDVPNEIIHQIVGTKHARRRLPRELLAKSQIAFVD